MLIDIQLLHLYLLPQSPIGCVRSFLNVYTFHLQLLTLAIYWILLLQLNRREMKHSHYLTSK